MLGVGDLFAPAGSRSSFVLSYDHKHVRAIVMSDVKVGNYFEVIRRELRQPYFIAGSTSCVSGSRTVYMLRLKYFLWQPGTPWLNPSSYGCVVKHTVFFLLSVLLGVLETTRIRQLGYPTRLDFATFIDRLV